MSMRYKRGDGLEFTVEEGSESQLLMERSGEFSRIGDDAEIEPAGGEKSTDTPEKPDAETVAAAKADPAPARTKKPAAKARKAPAAAKK